MRIIGKTGAGELIAHITPLEAKYFSRLEELHRGLNPDLDSERVYLEGADLGPTLKSIWLWVNTRYALNQLQGALNFCQAELDRVNAPPPAGDYEFAEAPRAGQSDMPINEAAPPPMTLQGTIVVDVKDGSHWVVINEIDKNGATVYRLEQTESKAAQRVVKGLGELMANYRTYYVDKLKRCMWPAT